MSNMAELIRFMKLTYRIAMGWSTWQMTERHADKDAETVRQTVKQSVRGKNESENQT